MSFIPTGNNDLFALVDCNNFYVSCERVFDPTARNIPVVVLSNNDGCAIARSEEAKAIGVPMGQAVFKMTELIAQHHIRLFSSNYVLYGDMSRRVMEVLKTFTPDIEIYSIDEAFLRLRGFSQVDIKDYANTICQTVYRHTGLPVCVGIAKTKTLAKVANYLAKRVYQSKVFVLTDEVDAHLKEVPVEKIWGIGQRRKEWLNSQGVDNAYDFKNMPDTQVKNKMTVTGLRTVWELRGIYCLELEEMVPDKKAIGCSRMFGHAVDDVTQLQEASAAYVSRACVKLRRQSLLAGYLHIVIETNRFRGPYYHNALGKCVSPPSAYTPLLSHYAKILLRKIYRKGYQYNRVGVMLTDLSSERQSQGYFIDPFYVGTRYQKLMQTIDRYNFCVNHGKIQLASEGFGQPWQMKQARKSKRFTTNWNELLIIE